MIYENDEFFVQAQSSELPWVKVFTKQEFLELSDMPKELYIRLWELVREIELALKQFYKADKINIASFANELPRVHIHIIARFKDDGFFPNSPWGERLRELKTGLESTDSFGEFLKSGFNKRNIK